MRLRALEAAGVPVLLADGAGDPVPFRERAAGAAVRSDSVRDPWGRSRPPGELMA